MLRPLSIGLLVSAIPLASLPAIAQEDGSADDLGVMSISLGRGQAPSRLSGRTARSRHSESGRHWWVSPLSVGENSVWFFDFANVNFADYGNYSSIINTDVAGVTINTSTRLGYRWLNEDRSWMFGLNASYDTRPMATAYADTGVSVHNRSTVFFRQAAVNAEAVSTLGHSMPMCSSQRV